MYATTNFPENWRHKHGFSFVVGSGGSRYKSSSASQKSDCVSSVTAKSTCYTWHLLFTRFDCFCICSHGNLTAPTYTTLLPEYAPKAITAIHHHIPLFHLLTHATKYKEHHIKILFGIKVSIDASTSIYQFLIVVRQKDGEMLANNVRETTRYARWVGGDCGICQRLILVELIAI